MKKILLSAALIAVSLTSFAQVGVGTNSPEASAALDVTATDKGFLMPRMADHTTIAAPAAGLQVYNTTTNTIWFYNGTAWVQGASGEGSKWTGDAANTRVALTNLSDGVTARPAGSEFYISDDSNLAIGTTLGNWETGDNGYHAIELGPIGSIYSRRTPNTAVSVFASNVVHEGLDGLNADVKKIAGEESSMVLLNNGRIAFNVSESIDPGVITWTEAMSIDKKGNVGIFTGSIAEKASALEVNGYIKVGSSDAKGDVTPKAGMIRFNSTTSKFQGYNGTSWVNTSGAKFIDGTNPLDAVFTGGNVGIGTTSVNSNVKLRIASANNLTVDLQIGTKGVDTNKFARIGSSHYAGDVEEAVSVVSTYSDATRNLVSIGGGTTLMNAATEIRFFTALDNITTQGTEKMRITPSGNVGIGTTTPGSKLSVVGLQQYNDNLAAMAGGLVAGDFYRTSDGTVKVVFPQ